MVSVDISEWEYNEVMNTIRWELQRELSWVRYRISRIIAFSGSALGVGSGAGWEKKPDYARAKKYIEDVSMKSDEAVVLFINYHGERPVGDFGWISKLGELPNNTTLVTEGYQRCERIESEEYEIGRLAEEQTIDYLTNNKGFSEEEAKEIHHIHDGNPVGIELALDSEDVKKPLTGDDLENLWEEVYDDKLTAEERDLLYGGSHLIDLDYRDVAMTVGKTRGECRQILGQLENKGVVSRKKQEYLPLTYM